MQSIIDNIKELFASYSLPGHRYGKDPAVGQQPHLFPHYDGRASYIATYNFFFNFNSF